MQPIRRAKATFRDNRLDLRRVSLSRASDESHSTQVKTIEGSSEQVGEQRSLPKQADFKDSKAAKASHSIMVVGILVLYRLDRLETGDSTDTTL